jgi:hypothetical protein
MRISGQIAGSYRGRHPYGCDVSKLYSKSASWKVFPEFAEVVILLRGLVLSSEFLNLKNFTEQN